MKKRFITVLLGVLLMPTVSFAGIPTVDVMGTPQAFMETVQTVFSKIENSQQVVTIQKTMAKIGSAKSTISDFINKTKDVATKYKTKMEEYINKGKEYLGKAQAFKAEAEKYIGMAKDISENGLGNTLKEKGGGILGGVAGELGLDGSKVENLANQAISGDFKSMAGDALGGVAGELGLDGSKVENLTNQAISGDFKAMAGDALGGVAGELGIDT
ncbi:MAG: hypothetical protein IKA30_04290, partial [Alphaproteobacteria bacterium]|nr:hypothetical protein [Alphaproteobacteria bacterium]